MKTVKSFDGIEIDVENYRKGLDKYPIHGRAYMGENGEVALCNITYAEPECGCKIIGCGTLQFPMSIQFCKDHAAINQRLSVTQRPTLNRH